MGKRKSHYKAKGGGGRGQFHQLHEAGKATKKKVKQESEKTVGGFEEWAERMVENPLKFLGWTVGFILLAVSIKILTT